MSSPMPPETQSRRQRSQAPQQPADEGAAAADAVESNRSLLNPQDAQVMMGRAAGAGYTQDTSLGEFITDFMGLDLNGPAIPQLQAFANAQVNNANPMDKMKNIAAGENVRTGAGAAAARMLSKASAGEQGPSQPAGPPQLDNMLGF